MRDSVEPLRGELTWGLLGCGCREPHPVVDGVPMLLPPIDPRGAEARAAISGRRVDLPAWLDSACRRWTPSLPPLPARPTGLQAVTEAGGGVFYEYLAWKWATRSFATGVALLGAAPPGLLVDLGCGMGHLAWAAARLQPDVRVIAIDHALPLLLAGRTLGLLPASHATLAICADANFGVPIADATASAVLISDGLHYFFRAQGVLTDVRRALGRDGVLVLNHLHNREAAAGEPAQGHSRTAPEWVAQVRHAGFAWQAGHDDEHLLAALAEDASPPTASPEALRRARSLSILAGGKRCDWRPGSLPDTPPLALNPVYARDGVRPAARLRWPSAFFAAEHASPLFPGRVSWPARPTRAERRALVSRLTWLPLPPGYVGPEQEVD